MLVLRDAINPSWPNVRPVMIFSNDSLGPMMPDDRFTAVGWGQVDANKPYCKFREKLLLSWQQVHSVTVFTLDDN